MFSGDELEPGRTQPCVGNPTLKRVHGIDMEDAKSGFFKWQQHTEKVRVACPHDLVPPALDSHDKEHALILLE